MLSHGILTPRKMWGGGGGGGGGASLLGLRGC